MSIILEALKKSERERQAGQVPGMAEVVHESERSRSNRLPWLLAFLAVLNLGGVGYWLYRDQKMPSKDLGQQQALASPQGSRSLEPVPEKDRVEPPLLPPLQAPSNDVRPPANVPQVAPAIDPEPQRPSVPLPERLMPPANPPVSSQEFDDVDAELEAEGVAKPNGVLARSPQGQGLPMLNDLPENFRSRIPPFRITMFAYSENPQDRFVIVNMKKLVAGDVLPGGVLLIEIRAENLVGELDGQKFLIPRY